ANSYQSPLFDQKVAIDQSDRQAAAGHVEAMNAQPRQPFEHLVALAQEIVGDNRPGDVFELGGRGIHEVVQHRVAQGHEHDDVLPGDSRYGLDQKLGGDRVDEFREKDHQGAALKPRIEFRKPECEVGLGVVVVEARGRAQQLVEVGNAAPRLLVMPQHLVEPEQPNEVPALERGPRQQQAGVDRVIEPRQAINRFDHEVTGVESEHDRMVAFDAKLLAQQFAMARGVLPIDEAAVEAGHVVAQRIEFAAFALLLLYLVSEQRLAREEVQRRAAHAAYVRYHVDRARNLDPAYELHNRNRALPAHPDRVDRDPPAPLRRERDARVRILTGVQLRAYHFLRGGFRLPFAQQLERHRSGAARICDGDDDGADFADLEALGRLRGQPQQ